jgi:succinoglycan biosynthesis protein ExoL
VRLVYFVHNLNDPAVAKRIAMLNAAGLETFVAGFWRGTPPQPQIQGASTLPLGESFDAKLAHRAALSLKHALRPGPLVEAIGKADLLMARNLEMLVIAAAIGHRVGMPVVYEVLDIHRLMTGAAGGVLRRIERGLMRDIALLLVSSPAFLKSYFERFQFTARRPVTAVIENKMLELDSEASPQQPTACERVPQPGPQPGPPWHIGWLGMLRCRKSLAILSRLAARRPDLVRIEIFGRPTKEVGEDLQWNLPDEVYFGGAYRHTDLADIYGRMHFNWAIDYFEEGLNSSWLLPNRIYEGGRHDVVALAVHGTETARWLRRLGLGVVLNDPERELESFLEKLTPEAYFKLKRASVSAPREAFQAGTSECDRLGRLLRMATGEREPNLDLAGQIALP